MKTRFRNFHRVNAANVHIELWNRAAFHRVVETTIREKLKTYLNLIIYEEENIHFPKHTLVKLQNKF